MVTSVTKGGTQKLAKKLRLSKPTDMTIHWKALEEDWDWDWDLDLLDPGLSILTNRPQICMFQLITKINLPAIYFHIIDTNFENVGS
jgi:hypothetical protein